MRDEASVMFSVIVASHRPDYISGLVEALRSSAEGSHPFELIVVADYPTEAAARRYPHVRWIYHGDRSISAKRNRGAQVAGGRLLAFVDDDCLPHQGWLAAAAEYLERHPRVAGVEGRTVIEEGAAAEPYLREFRRLEIRGFRTNNICYRADIFGRVGMFDERFTVQREDVDLAFTVMEAGYTIGYCPSMTVTHRLRPRERWDLLKNCLNRRFDPLLHRKHPRLYRSHIGTPFPAALALLLGVHVVAALLLGVNRRWGAAALLGDAAAAAALTLRRSGLSCRPPTLAREWVSSLAAPFVLSAALLYGSVKYRHFLLR